MAQEKEKYELIPLDQIEVQHDENVRSGDWLNAKGGGPGDEGTGFHGKFKDPNTASEVQGGIVGSILKSGQDTPIWVRTNPDPKKATKQPYKLISGYRRYEAVKALNVQTVEIPGLPANSIKAIVKPCPNGDADAHILNIKENLDRENLRVPDEAWGMWRMMKDGWVQVSIAQACGKTQSWVSKLTNIVEGVPSKVFQAWRRNTLSDGKTGAPELTSDQMYSLIPPPKNKTGPTTPDEAIERYDAMCKEKAGKKDAKKKGTKPWLTKATKAAELFGAQLGMLTGTSVLDDQDFGQQGTWAEIVEALGHFTTKDEVTEKQQEKILEAAMSGYKAGRKAAKDAEEESKKETNGASKKGQKEARA